MKHTAACVLPFVMPAGDKRNFRAGFQAKCGRVCRHGNNTPCVPPDIVEVCLRVGTWTDNYTRGKNCEIYLSSELFIHPSMIDAAICQALLSIIHPSMSQYQNQGIHHNNATWNDISSELTKIKNITLTSILPPWLQMKAHFLHWGQHAWKVPLTTWGFCSS